MSIVLHKTSSSPSGHSYEPNELNELFQRIMVCVPGIPLSAILHVLGEHNLAETTLFFCREKNAKIRDEYRKDERDR